MASSITLTRATSASAPAPLDAADPPTAGKVERRDRLGGLIHEYYRAAA